MRKKNLLSSLCIAVMLSAPTTGMAQQKGQSGRAPFDTTKKIARAMNTPEKNNETVAGKSQRHGAAPVFSVKFDSQEVFETFTVINVNEDDGKWEFYEKWNGSKSACYKYSVQNEADDWLISPKMRLEAGVNYDIKFRALSDSKTYVERMEVKMGREATKNSIVAGDVILPPTELNGDTVTLTRTFTPTESGEYCIGFHAISDANQNRLLLFDVKVEKGAAATAPAMPENFNVVPDAKGDLKAKISFKAPSKNVGGDNLTAIDSVVVTRNAEIIAVLKNIAPGSNRTYDDNSVTVNGNNTYSIAAYYAGNRGTEVEKTVFVGVDLPAMPDAFTISDNKTSIAAQWTAVTRGANNGIVNPDKMTYKIRAFDAENKPTIVVKDVMGECDTQIDVNTGEGEQHLQQYAVAASNNAGTGEFAYSNAIIVGKPDALPFREGFSDGFKHDFEHFWWMDGEGSGYNYGMSVVSFEKVSGDGDGSCLKFTTLGYNDKLNINTGKIKLESSNKLKLAFTYKTDGSPDAKFNVMAIMPGGYPTMLGSYNISEAADWKTAQITVPEYMGAVEYVMFRFQLEATGSPSVPQTLYLDNVKIAVAADTDIAAGLILPEKAQRGNNIPIKVKVKNYGSSDATGYKVTVKAAGATVFDETVNDVLSAFGYKEVPVVLATSVVEAAETLPVTVSITINGDEDTDNNSAEGSIKLYDYVGNTVGDLAGANVAGGVKLTWKAPQPKIENITEDFENYAPWLIDNVGDWKMVDRDKNHVGSLFEDLQLPHQYEKYAFMVTNFEVDYSAGSYFPGHSGYSYLSSFYCINEDGSENAPNDNWLISPDLSGNAQTISFYAINHDAPQQPFKENVNVLYSTTDNEPESFVKIGDTHVISNNMWEEISVNLPEGALFFAIQSKNDAGQCNWLGIDDIKFEKGTGNVKSYNIYRDGVKIGSVKDVNEFIDNAPLNGSHKYQVTVVYANGNESAPATVYVETGTSGISTITDAAEGAAFDIYDISGKRVRSNATSLDMLPKGVYVVNGKKFVVK
ncbi:MAG: choice-of-anchor J domain-containing protein [Prevotella sp.]|uniref:choice-of-anchor J domain-containing protein n=1 Tax=Prevotella sp. TaxID=59823 RepID=UPI002A2B75B6|nr:choice-of-anchor J domain-containing protein [Prevotella sp.]MDD7318934.1 choice-of-anchor J domain-containing protein [Prevotellaceae bacterium]MDY4019960.1 choice-of-anchor J domain-containing protein [Prevotella sp.]